MKYYTMIQYLLIFIPILFFSYSVLSQFIENKDQLTGFTGDLKNVVLFYEQGENVDIHLVAVSVPGTSTSWSDSGRYPSNNQNPIISNISNSNAGASLLKIKLDNGENVEEGGMVNVVDRILEQII